MRLGLGFIAAMLCTGVCPMGLPSVSFAQKASAVYEVAAGAEVAAVAELPDAPEPQTGSSSAQQTPAEQSSGQSSGQVTGQGTSQGDRKSVV